MNRRTYFASLLVRIAKTTPIEQLEPILASIQWSLSDLDEDLVETTPPEILEDIMVEKQDQCPLEVLLTEIKTNPLVGDRKNSERLIRELEEAIKRKKEKSGRMAA